MTQNQQAKLNDGVIITGITHPITLICWWQTELLSQIWILLFDFKWSIYDFIWLLHVGPVRLMDDESVMVPSTRPIQMFIQWCKSLPERSSLENRYGKLEITILSCCGTSWIRLLTSPLHTLEILIVQMKTFFFIPLFLSPPLLPSCTNLISHYFSISPLCHFALFLLL